MRSCKHRPDNKPMRQKGAEALRKVGDCGYLSDCRINTLKFGFLLLMGIVKVMIVGLCLWILKGWVSRRI